MHKELKFHPLYVEAVGKQDIGTTMRLFDDKSLSEGDVVDFINSDTHEKFATASIEKVEESTFEEAMKGAADADGVREMYEGYYQKKILPQTPVKFVHYIIQRK